MQRELLQPFDSAPRLLGRSARVFFSRLPFLVSVTLAVFIPGKLVAQLVCAALDVPPEGIERRRLDRVAVHAHVCVGRRLLAALEDHARSGGATVVQLETNRVLAEAIAMYRASGYVEVAPFNSEPYAHHWFEKRLSGGARNGRTARQR